LAIVLVLAGLIAGAFGLYKKFGLMRAAAAPKLNLLLITLDTTRADHLGCYGNAAAQTPNLDRLAQEGARFARCTSCSPLTLPSHASIMTGVCPNVHGARRNGTGHLSAANQTLAETLLAAGYRTAAAVGSFVLNRQFGVAQGFEDYHDVIRIGAGDALQAERRADVVCDDAIKLLQSHAAGRFFLWVHFYDPHYPYLSSRHPDPSSPEAYADEIAFMDENIGRLLAELRRLKLDADTLVVAVGDHGEGLGQHDESTHGFFLYDTTLHVPLIFRLPGKIDAGSVISSPVRTIDILPTSLDLLDRPEMPDIEGTSFCALFHGQNLPASLPSYSETFEANTQFGLSPLRSLERDGWKYILAPESELYDLTADPGESRDLASGQVEQAASLRQQLRSFVAEGLPPVPIDSQAGLNPDEVRRLESLGYVGHSTSLPSTLAAELDLFEPKGGNPRSYAAAIRLDSQARDAYANGQFAKAEELFRRLIQDMPDAPQPHAGLAKAVRSQGRLDEALEIVRATLESSPDNEYVRTTYGSLLTDAKRWEEAVAQFQLVLRQNPSNTTVLQNTGLALIFLGRLDEAEQHLQIGLSVQPDSTRLLRAMGALRARQNRMPEAAEYLRKALAIDPNYREAAEDLRQVERALPP
jgi:arylsulfatase A-like enzyme/Tfp pilus assembly protein PilF